VKLLIAEVDGQAVSPVLETSDQTRLGRGLYETGRMSPEAIAETARAVAKFAALAAEHQAAPPRVFATSAAREAANRDDLLVAIQTTAGIKAEIISGEQEAEWVFQGVSTDPRFQGKPICILEVGGGSTELIFGEQSHASFSDCYPIGSVRLLERLHLSDPPTPDNWRECRSLLQRFMELHIRPSLAAKAMPILAGTGGTVTILARMEARLDDYNREAIEAVRLSQRQIAQWRERLWSLPLAERQIIPGLPPKRADVILMGIAIFEVFMEMFHFPELHISSRGLRFGAILEASGSPKPPSPEAAARGEILTLMREREQRPFHVAHVTQLAGQIFDSLEPLHGLGPFERLLLEAAGYLHDIGHNVNELDRSHHKESARIIRQHPWRNFAPHEVELIAQVARYHRKSMPTMNHPEFMVLSGSEQRIVKVLAAILRLADSLDRNHEQFVSGIRTELATNRIVFHLETSGPALREVLTAYKKGDLALAVFQRDLVFMVDGKEIKPDDTSIPEEP
jgi:exopolyphosphatase / guanosine-5'-triphosphate,3'-diphosphate pyrophosphatase